MTDDYTPSTLDTQEAADVLGLPIRTLDKDAD